MPYFSKKEMFTDLVFVHQYAGIDHAQLGMMVDDLLIKNKYKLISGVAGKGSYEKGDRTMRLLFGAFVKYNKIDVNTFSDGDSFTRLKVNRTTTGMSGGIIGINQVKAEMARLSEIFSGI